MREAGLAGTPSEPVRARAAARVAAIPTWLVLGALVLVSSVFRYVLARRNPAPWAIPDELIYAEFAKSFAASGEFAIREATGLAGFGPVYPLLLVPAYRVFSNLAQAYAAAKATNCVLMSFAAVPTYLLARRLLARPLALLAAVFALAIPSMAYTGMIMTENAFYPIFVGFVLAVVLALERPTFARQLLVLAALALAVVTRLQALALVPGLVTAIVVFAALETRDEPRERLRGLIGRLERFAPTWLALGAGTIAVIGLQELRGQPLRELLGPYSGVVGETYTAGAISRWFVYHLAELDLYLGFVPFAAFALAVWLAWRRGESAALRAFTSATLGTGLWLALLVSAFATQPLVQYVEERYLFYLAPLFLIGLLVVVQRGMPRPHPLAATAAGLTAALPGILPLETLVPKSTEGPHTLAFFPLLELEVKSGVLPDVVRALVVVAAIAGAALFLLVPARYAIAFPALVLVFFVVVGRPVQRQMYEHTLGSLQLGMTLGQDREWIDDLVGHDADVPVVWSGLSELHGVWQNEFFNRSVGRVYDLGVPPPGNLHLPETEVDVQPRTGAIADSAGQKVDARYALTDRAVTLVGSVIARDPVIGTTLYRVSSPVEIASLVRGLYPNDIWSGPQLSYTRYRCRGGRLTVIVESSGALFPKRQTITANWAGQRLVRTTFVPATERPHLTVPLRPRGGTCTVDFTVTPTAVPASVLGNGDPRVLGARFLSFRYSPPSRAS